MKHITRSAIFPFILVGSLLSANSYAMPPKPAKCPSIVSLKSGGLQFTEYDEGSYFTYQISSYGTKSTWIFGIDDIQATSPQEALVTGYQALVSLGGAPSPIAIPSENVWACLYTNNLGLFSMAVTLPVANLGKSVKLLNSA